MRKKKESLVQFNKENIINAAEELFSRKGINQTTMDEIAKFADYSKSTIYVYFKSKEEIFNHIIYKHMCELRDLLKESIAQKKSTKECYYDICFKLVSAKESAPLYFESMMGSIGFSKEAIEKEQILGQVYQVGEEINELMSGFLKEGMEEGSIRKDIEILPMIFVMWSGIQSVITMAYNKEEYILNRINMTKEAYLQYGFEALYRAVESLS